MLASYANTIVASTQKIASYLVELFKQQSNIKDRREISKIKLGLQKLASKTSLTSDNGDIEELTAKVKQIAQDS